MGGKALVELSPQTSRHHWVMTKPTTPETLEAQLARLELAGRSVGDIIPQRRLEWAAYQMVLAAAGIDPVTLEWNGQTYDQTDVEERLVEPLSHAWDHLHANLSGFPPLYQAEWSPMFALGNTLRRSFGISHRQTSHHTGRYAPKMQALALRRDLLVKRRAYAT